MERAAHAAALDPGPQALGSREQRGKGVRLVREDRFGALHLALLIEVGLDDPLMKRERRPRGVDDLAAVDDAEIGLHPQPQALKRNRQVPGINQVTIDGGLTTDSLKA